MLRVVRCYTEVSVEECVFDMCLQFVDIVITNFTCAYVRLLPVFLLKLTSVVTNLEFCQDLLYVLIVRTCARCRWICMELYHR